MSADLKIARAAIRESAELTASMLDSDVVADVVTAADTIARGLDEGGTLILFGNGGSAAEATHIAAEFLGRYLRERGAVPALSLSDNASAVTAIGNDYGYDAVFSRQIEGLGRPQDVALAISTSGTSANVLAGVWSARARGMATIGLTGSDGGELRDAVELCVTVPSASTPRIQECHTLIAHVICELVERRLR